MAKQKSRKQVAAAKPIGGFGAFPPRKFAEGGLVERVKQKIKAVFSPKNPDDNEGGMVGKAGRRLAGRAEQLDAMERQAMGEEQQDKSQQPKGYAKGGMVRMPMHDKRMKGMKGC